MDLPHIGDRITPETAVSLCRFYHMTDLAQRITDHPDWYRSWDFDGCSLLPDNLAAALTGIESLTEICLRHDLRYAYGDPGNREERLRADYLLGLELLDAGAGAVVSKAFFDGVRLGGGELGLSFSWAFARK